MSFSLLNLSQPILKAVEEQGYHTPSPVQQQAIPAVLSGKDVMAAAQTGTGKTAGFTLPIIEKLLKGKPARANEVRALILTPTRELAAQVASNVATYGQHTKLRANVVFGGVKINPQMMKLRSGSDVLVATPGRLLDLYQQNAVKFSQLEVLVLDEADRMLDMGFIRDIKKILSYLPAQRQNLLFSATFSPDIKALAQSFVHNPVEISVSPSNSTAKTVEQVVVPCDKKKKSKLLSFLIKENQWQQVLVFTKTKHGANRLTKELDSQGISALAIHGNKSQGARTKALAKFKDNEISVLVATDIAARGLDIDQLPQVVNFELPHVSEDYVHRIGRTGRAGADGFAVSLVCADEHKLLEDIEYVIQQHVERKIEPGFEPVNALPPSRKIRPLKAKKPKKPKVNSSTAQGKESARSNEHHANSGKRHVQKRDHKKVIKKNRSKKGSSNNADPYAANR
ncbi:DEAD/DEAH box helicase [Thalassotalea sp. 1_MG-2023]|uniref:DEAD/DEAH box helicase n=1 Tax=Thalassotalea sp. 1_MG-2023 TaxID=3062680 RepID=UPI0026E19720|nr:DEAD/DEAH box helicase [Thalassotalea sp. 1_MG-2023]MDO6428549.1 DEAD/DEAH box helicase [Thalassotalea sp. 1_MG-2023]